MKTVVHELFEAIRDADLERVRQLLQAGAAVDQRDDDGNTPLMICLIHGGFEAMLRLFIAHGADVNAVNDEGQSALVIACGNPVLAWSAGLLLGAGAQVNILPKDGKSPLFKAVYRGDLELARALLEAGADPNLGPDDPEDGTMLQWAVDYGDLEFVRTLIGRGANVNAPGVLHAATRHVSLLRDLVEQGVDVNQPGPWGSTALHVAAYHCRYDAVRLLLEHGADPAIRDLDENQTPLEWYEDGECDDPRIPELLSRR